MKIAIVGWGIEGQSAMRFFGPEHDYLIVNEHPRDDFPAASDKIKIQHLQSPKPGGVTGSTDDLSYLAGIENCDKVVYSVTSYWNLKKTFGGDEAFWRKATTVMHIFFEQSPTKNIVGVTGSKGKGTTTTLIYKMLKAAGKTTHIGGNIGVSVLDLLPDIKPEDWVVLEMSNFQLNHFPYSPHIGVCLKITKEHLDWHPDFDSYIEAKANLFRWQTEADIAVYFAANEFSQKIAGYSKGQKIPYMAAPGAVVKDEGVITVGEPETKVIKTSEIKLLGEHNLENVTAALTAVWQIDQNLEAIRQVLRNFSGLEHRLEFVREIDGVKYYDDSFGTTPDTAVVAIRALVAPKVVILGGVDKGIPFDELIEEIVRARVRHVVAIGKSGPQIAAMLRDKGFSAITEGLKTMPEIVAKAREMAHPGDVVLLAPAGSSYDMFVDYKDRGDQFHRAVNSLK